MNAWATVFTPISTVHALTARATVSSDTRLAINQDVYEKEAAQLITGAIDATYDRDCTQYAATLESMHESKVLPPLEIAEYQARATLRIDQS